MEMWQQAIEQRFIANANRDGSWGYRPGAAGSAEATALAALALANHEHKQIRKRALDWLAGLQRQDGGVPVCETVGGPCWPTALALLAWWGAGPSPAGTSTYLANVEAAKDWLLRHRGLGQPRTELIGHDTTLVAWPWVAETHSWAEPTAYAILALQAAGEAAHPRVVEGRALLLDRAVPSGGWNYGNKRVIENILRPFPATTGVVLAALAGAKGRLNDHIEKAVVYLADQLPRIRAPLSLSWGLIGLTAWERRPEGAEHWLAEAANQSLQRESNALYDALLILAALDNPVAAFGHA